MLTQEQIKALREKEGLSPTPAKTNVNAVIADFDALTAPEPSAYNKKVVQPLASFSKGFVKSGAEHLQNLGNVVAKPVGKAMGISEEKIGISPETLQRKGTAEKIGGTVESIAEFAIPAAKVGKLSATSKLLAKIGTRALTSGAVASAQEGKIGTGTALAVGTEVAFPVIGKYAVPVIGRLFKGLGAGLSGTPVELVNTLTKNAKKAKEFSNQLVATGGDKVLEDNAKTIINGVSKIKQEARDAYGVGLETLKTTDINPTTFRSSVQKMLDKFGVSVKGATRSLDNVEFDNPKNLQKASDLIDELSKTDLDGYSLRKLIDKINKSAYKVATSDERLSFNAFIRDLSDSVKQSINGSTKKLTEINKAYTTDLQLAEAVEDIFKDVNYKNMSEVAGVARKLETLFTKKALDPSIIDKFLTRIGVSPADFRTSEAVRQISSKVSGANAAGLTFGELTQQITSAVITPNMVKNISIYTGLAEPIAKEIFSKISPAARGALLESLVSTTDE